MVIYFFELLCVLNGLVHRFFFLDFDVELLIEFLSAFGDALVQVFDFFFFLFLFELEVLLDFLEPGDQLTISL